LPECGWLRRPTPSKPETSMNLPLPGILRRLLDALRQLGLGVLASRSPHSAWELHQKGYTLGAALAYCGMPQARSWLSVIALQLQRLDWAHALEKGEASPKQFMLWLATKFKTRPIEDSNPLVALEKLLPHLLTPRREALLDFASEVLPSEGRVLYL